MSSGARSSLLGSVVSFCIMATLCGGCVFGCILPSVWQARNAAEQEAKRQAEQEAQIAEYAPELKDALNSCQEQISSWTNDMNQLSNTIQSVGQNPAEDADIKSCQEVIQELREVEGKLWKARGDILIALDKTGRKTSIGDEEARLQRAQRLVAKAVEESKRAVRIAAAKQRRIDGAMGREELSDNDSSPDTTESANISDSSLAPVESPMPSHLAAESPKLPRKDEPPFVSNPASPMPLIPSIPTAPAHEPATALSAEPELVDGMGVRLVLVSPGEFQMGSDKPEIDAAIAKGRTLSDKAKELLMSELPKHRVKITRAFYLGATEVTVGQFKQFVTATSYKSTAEIKNAEKTWQKPGFAQTDNHPVTAVSWRDATEFCQWATRVEMIRYRLPTEAEWEFACRATSNTAWFWGSEPKELELYTWSGIDSPKKTKSVATKQANVWGLFDMQGNVSEWCLDHYDSGYYVKSPINDPQGPVDAETRVLRGGSVNFGDVTFFRSALRGSLSETSSPMGVGFRVIREIQ